MTDFERDMESLTAFRKTYSECTVHESRYIELCVATNRVLDEFDRSRARTLGDLFEGQSAS